MRGSELLRMQLLRLRRASLATQYAAWEGVRVKYFKGLTQQDSWVNSELTLFQKESNIWNRVTASHSEKSVRYKIDVDDQYDFEIILNALTLRSNFEAANWSKIWFMLIRDVPDDQRLYELARQWLYYQYSNNDDRIEISGVFCAVLDEDNYQSIDQEMADFLLDIIQSGGFDSGRIIVPIRLKN